MGEGISTGIDRSNLSSCVHVKHNIFFFFMFSHYLNNLNVINMFKQCVKKFPLQNIWKEKHCWLINITK